MADTTAKAAVRVDDSWKIVRHGFTQMPNTVLCDNRLSAEAVMAYLVLGSYAFGKSVVWPSGETISEQMRCSRPTAIKAVKELERCGYVRIESRGPGKGNVYILQGDAGPDPEPVNPVYNPVNAVYNPVKHVDRVVNPVDTNKKHEEERKKKTHEEQLASESDDSAVSSLAQQDAQADSEPETEVDFNPEAEAYYCDVCLPVKRKRPLARGARIQIARKVSEAGLDAWKGACLWAAGEGITSINSICTAADRFARSGSKAVAKEDRRAKAAVERRAAKERAAGVFKTADVPQDYQSEKFCPICEVRIGSGPMFDRQHEACESSEAFGEWYEAAYESGRLTYSDGGRRWAVTAGELAEIKRTGGPIKWLEGKGGSDNGKSHPGRSSLVPTGSGVLPDLPARGAACGGNQAQSPGESKTTSGIRG